MNKLTLYAIRDEEKEQTLCWKDLKATWIPIASLSEPAGRRLLLPYALTLDAVLAERLARWAGMGYYVRLDPQGTVRIDVKSAEDDPFLLSFLAADVDLHYPYVSINKSGIPLVDLIYQIRRMTAASFFGTAEVPNPELRDLLLSWMMIEPADDEKPNRFHITWRALDFIERINPIIASANIPFRV